MKKPPRLRQGRNRFDKADHSVRLGGREPRIGRQTEFIEWAASYRQLMKAMQASGARRRQPNRPPGSSPRDRIFRQRVAVRVRYSKQKGKGQWKAHGTYIQRESANPGKLGFDATTQEVPIAETLNRWQKDNDEQLWKIIISPEHGDRMNLEEHTRQLLKQMERDLGVALEWTAAVHRNTHKPHVHVALRGRDRQGRTVRLPPDYIKRDLRERSEALATIELGHRFEADIVHSQRQQILQARFTDLDRALLKRRERDGSVYVNSADSELKGLRLATELHCEQRLAHLAEIGLAERLGAQIWRLPFDLERSLRAMQQTQDRQKITEQFGVLASDPKTPFQRTKWRDLTQMEGRILVHGQEDNQHQAFLLLEDVNGKIHYLDHRPEVEALRQVGRLQPGSYTAMRVVFAEGKPRWIIEDLGPADQAIHNEEFIEHCLRRGVHPPAHGFGGWLGQFRDKIEKARHQPEERVFTMPEARPWPGYPKQQPVSGKPNSRASVRSDDPLRPDLAASPVAGVGSTHEKPDQSFRRDFSEPVSARRDHLSPPSRQRRLVTLAEAEKELGDTLWEMGLVLTRAPLMDGKPHRVVVDTDKRGKKSGEYCIHPGAFPAGYIRNYKTGERVIWKASAPTQYLSAEERIEQQKRIETQKAQAERERERQEKSVARWSEQTWSQAQPVDQHPYLTKKGVSAHSLRMNAEGSLVVPMRDLDGKVWSLQWIEADGSKRYKKHGRKQGTHYLLGEIDLSKPLVLAEGYATGATMHELTALPVGVVFDSSNLLPVAQAYRERYPDLPIIIAADNDHHLPKKIRGTGKPMPNVGIQKAEQAAQAVGGFVIAPTFQEQDPGTDWNDYAAQHGQKTAQAVFVTAWQNGPAVEVCSQQETLQEATPAWENSRRSLEELLEEVRQAESWRTDTNPDSLANERRSARRLSR